MCEELIAGEHGQTHPDDPAVAWTNWAMQSTVPSGGKRKGKFVPSASNWLIRNEVDGQRRIGMRNTDRRVAVPSERPPQRREIPPAPGTRVRVVTPASPAEHHIRRKELADEENPFDSTPPVPVSAPPSPGCLRFHRQNGCPNKLNILRVLVSIGMARSKPDPMGIASSLRKIKHSSVRTRSSSRPRARLEQRSSGLRSPGMRLRPGKNALSENPIIFAANQYAPLNLKRLIPRPVVEFIRRLLSPRTSSSSPPASAPGEVQRDPSFDWLGPFFASVGLDGEPAAIFSALRAAGYPVYETPAAAERVAQIVRASGLFDEQSYRSLVPRSRATSIRRCIT